MISIVLYGRNDSYGYNLQKRAALSINCIAEALDDVDDEIIFVDYNTPDDLPTFPEAIQDVLTSRAREMLRILRVRPDVHQKHYAGRTRLKALEPISRNIAIRRSNPRNRWILSTNSDMIFVPRGVFAGQSLSKLAAALPDGFYHTPRMELPESLWETLDRTAPNEIIDKVVKWGTSLRLNEIVHGNPEILFDGPGDFQLMLREDLFEIDGFDERMILGWHVDSNIAKRLYIYRGGIGSAADYVFGYHCDHTRESSPLHAQDHVQNDFNFYFHAVATAHLPEQRETWGLPALAIEEVRITPASQTNFAQVLERIVTPLLDRDYLESALLDKSYDDLRYDVDHIVAFLANDMITMPPGSTLAYFGGRRATFGRVRQLWQAFSRGGAILLTPEIADLLGASAGDDLRIVVEEDVERNADLFMVDFGLPSQAEVLPDPSAGYQLSKGPQTEQDAKTLDTLLSALIRTSASEPYTRGARQRRRFIVTNTHNTCVEGPVNERLLVTLTPYGTGVRHGFAFANAFEPDGDLDLCPNADGRAALMGLFVQSGSASMRGLSRIMSIDDWRLPDWFRSADTVLGRRMAKSSTWDRTMWQHAHIHYALSQLGLLRRDARGAAVSAAFDYAHVNLLKPWVQYCGLANVEQFRDPAVRISTPLDFAIITQHAVAAFGVEGLPALLEGVERMLKPGGACILTADILLAGERSPDFLDVPLVTSGVFGELLAEHTSLELQGPLDLKMSTATLERLIIDNTPSQVPSHCVVSDAGGRQRTSVALVYRKRMTTAPSNWTPVRMGFSAALASTIQHADLPALGAAFQPPAPQLRPYPGWAFRPYAGSPSRETQFRHAIWRASGIDGAPVLVPFYYGMRLAARFGNDLSQCTYVEGVYDPNEFFWLAEALRPGMTVIDVGANEGLYSVFAGRRVGSRGRVIAVEPSTRERARFEQNVAINALTNITLLPIAASKSAGAGLLRIAEAPHSGQNTLDSDPLSAVAQLGTEPVIVRTVDAIVAEQQVAGVGLLRIAYEANQQAVLEGALQTLHEYRPAIMLERRSLHGDERSAFDNKVLCRLFEAGYDAHVIDTTTGLARPARDDESADSTLIAVPVIERRQQREASAQPLPTNFGARAAQFV